MSRSARAPEPPRRLLDDADRAELAALERRVLEVAVETGVRKPVAPRLSAFERAQNAEFMRRAVASTPILHRSPNDCALDIAEAFENRARETGVFDVREVLTGTTRAGDSGPATVTFAVSDAIAKALRGPEEKAAFVLYIVTMPADIPRGRK